MSLAALVVACAAAGFAAGLWLLVPRLVAAAHQRGYDQGFDDGSGSVITAIRAREQEEETDE